MRENKVSGNNKLSIIRGKDLPQNEFTDITLLDILYGAVKQGKSKGIYFIKSNKNEEFLSYEELFNIAKVILSGFRKQGLKSGDKVILEIKDDKDFFCAFWASLLGGIIPAPISTPPSYNIESAEFEKIINVWEILDKPLIITEVSSVEKYNDVKNKGNYEGLKVISINEFEGEEQAKHFHQPSSDEIAYLQFSSGSTGIPKGVILTHANIISNIIAICRTYNINYEDVSISWLPHTHDMGLIGLHLLSVFQSINQIKMEPQLFLRRPNIYLEKITEHKATISSMPNFGLFWLLEKVKDEDIKNSSFSSIRALTNGAEPISINVMNEFIKKYNKYGFKSEAMCPAYGMAEASVALSFTPLSEKVNILSIKKNEFLTNGIVEDSIGDSNTLKIVDEGYPIYGVEIRIVDDYDNVVDENTVGNIQICGPNVTSGYINNEEANENLFCDNWLRTGDMGFIRNGRLAITGRKKEVIFVHGINYYANDIEEIIYDLKEIRRGDLGVVGVHNYDLEIEEILVFVKNRGEIVDFLNLRQQIMKKVNMHFGISIKHVIPVNIIPKTTSGKIQRLKLREEYLQGKYLHIINEVKEEAEKHISHKDDFELPSTELEDKIRKIWAEVLGIEKSQISVNDNFTEIGGDSVKATQVLLGLEKMLNKELSHHILINKNTIKELASYFEGLKLDNYNLVEEIILNEEKRRHQSTHSHDVAVVGISLRFPGSRTVDEFWEHLKNGDNLVKYIDQNRKNLSGYKEWNDYLGYIDNIDRFDAEFFNISRQEAIYMDPQQRLALQVAYEALEDGHLLDKINNKSNIGVYFGASQVSYNELVLDYLKDSTNFDKIHPSTMVGNLLNMISARISHTFGLTGPSMTIDTACSSSLAALCSAVQSLRNGEIEGALVGGANLILTPSAHILSNKAGILSSQTKCQVFGEESDGTLLGEGIGVVYLEPLENAIKSGKNIYGVIKGIGINNDGASLGIMAPNPDGQLRVLIQAYNDAQLTPSEVSYIEAHGTGTALGDPIEIKALNQFFKRYINNDNCCDIGSVKSNMGHLLPAAGIAGFIKTLLCLKNKSLVPSINIEKRNTILAEENSVLDVPTRTKQWETINNKKRIAGVSSFGFGGTNVHVVVEEPPIISYGQIKDSKDESFNSESDPWKLLPISAKTSGAVYDLLDKYDNYFNNSKYIGKNLIDICHNASLHRKHYDHRLCLIAKDKDEIKQQLANIIGEGKQSFCRNFRDTIQGKLAFVFSGQGNQWYPMGRQFFRKYKTFKDTIRKCDGELRKYVNWSLIDKIDKDEYYDILTNTEFAQLLIFSIQVALSEQLKSWGIIPEGIVGHSLGEVSAAYVSGVIEFEEAIKIVVYRSKLMQKSWGTGKMVLVNLTENETKEMINEIDKDMKIAVINDDSSIVVSGDPDSITELANVVQKKNIYHHLISHDFAFHSHKMEPYKAELISSLLEVSPSKAIIPLYSTVTGRQIKGIEMDSDYWGNQLCNQVQFKDAIDSMISNGYSYFVELGPHGELSTSIMKMLEHNNKEGLSISCMQRNQDEDLIIHSSIKKIYEMGYDIDWSKLYPHSAPYVELPLYPWQEESYWINVRGTSKNYLNLSENGRNEESYLTQHVAQISIEENAREELANLSIDERREIIEGYIIKKVAEKLGKVTEKIDSNISIISLGLDSLHAMELKNYIEKELNVNISIITLMQGPSIKELSLLLSEEINSQSYVKSEVKIVNQDEYPLSYGQQALWSIYKMSENNSAYNINFGLSIYSDLNVSRLERCISKIIQQHKSLRTSYRADSEKIVQRVLEYNNFNLEIKDVVGVEKTIFDSIVEEYTHQKFDLENGEVVRIKLFKRAENLYVLVFSFHHIAVDLWSLELIISDLLQLYNSENMEFDSLSSASESYLDFVYYQNKSKDSEQWEKMFKYWKNELRGELPNLNLPIDNPRPEFMANNGSTFSFKFDKHTSEKLKDFAQHNGVTLFTLLLGLYKLFLYRITEQNDILVGTPTLGRNKKDFEKIVGYFVNTIVVRSHLEGDLSFDQFINNLNETVIKGLDNQEYPFSLIVDKLNPRRIHNQNPIFQTMFVFEKASHLTQLSSFILGQNKEKVIVGDLEIGPYTIGKTASQFDMTLIVADEGEYISALFEYNTDIFSEKTIIRFAEQVNELAKNVINNSQCKLREISIVSQKEKSYYLNELNNTFVAYPINQCVHRIFEEYAISNPHDIAIIAKDKEITYKELNEKANNLAHYLIEIGLTRGAIVGIRMQRSIELVIGMLAILKAGGAYMPIDINYPIERVHFMLQDASSPIIINGEGNLSLDNNIKIVNYNEVILGDNLIDPDIYVDPTDLVYVIYTSGSTGKPKGVMVEHSSLVNMIYAHRSIFNETSSDKLSQLASISFDACAFEIWPTLTIGAKLCIVEDEIRSDPDKLKNWLIDSEINIAFVPTPMGEILLSMDWHEEMKLRSLRIAGDKLHKYPKSPLPFKIFNLYGPTEATIWATYYEVPFSPDQQEPPLGKPIDNTQIYILDDNMEPCTEGMKGEIYIGGEGVARGYINRSDLEAKVFLQDPFTDKDNARLYKTGDLGYYLPNGNIAFAGRKDYQVKIRGYRVELEEIETVISQHPSVNCSAVITKDDKNKNTKQLVAFIKFNNEDIIENHYLRDWLREKVPEYMIPHIFVTLDEIPLTINGKIDKKKLSSMVPKNTSLADDSTSARTYKEEILTEIWSNVLGINNIHIDDNFFNLGGDSILAIQVVSNAKKYGYKITTNDIFKNQSIRELANIIGEEREDDTTTPSLITGEVHMTPVQQWFFGQELKDPTYWNQGILLEVKNYIDLSLLKISVTELIRQHDMLRAYFKKSNGITQQFIAGEVNEISILEYDLSELDSKNTIDTITNICNKHQSEFVLEEPPLIKVILFHNGKDKQQYMYLLAHHLIIDGISWRILIEDLFDFYNQLTKNNRIIKPRKSTSFKEWSNSLQEYIRDDSRKEDVRFWLESPWEEYVAIPKDLEYYNNLEKDTGLVRVELNAEYTEKALRKVHKSHKTNMEEMLITGLTLALRKWSGKDSTIIDLESHGRSNKFESIDLSRTVGWFTSVYPVFIKLKGNDLGSHITKIKETLRSIPNYGIDYGMFKYYGNKDIQEKFQRIPKAEICFNYLGKLDMDLGDENRVRLVNDFKINTRAEDNERAYLIEINSYILNNRLQFELTFNKKIHKESIIEKFALNFMEQITDIINYAIRQKGEITPSDYPDIDLTQHELNSLTAIYGHIDDIYPLSPLQEGILFQSLFKPEPGLYIEQLSCTIEGIFNPMLFEKSWNQIIERNSILRTAFKWEGLEQAVQIVLPTSNINFSHHNLIDRNDISNYIKILQEEDLKSQFKLDHAPLMRFNLIKLSENSYKFIWTHHHLLLDGWSLSLILKEVFQIYNSFATGNDIYPKNIMEYKDYIDWISKQDMKKAEKYFKETMDGFERPVITGYENNLTDRGNKETDFYKEVSRRLSTKLSNGLSSFSRDNQITLNTIFQGIWALLLSKYSGEKDIVFGSTLSGRPPSLDEVESIVGLFINVLPTRIRVALESNVIEWLKDIQSSQSELRQYEYAPLVEVQKWSQIPNDIALFESIVVFENYPIDEGILENNKDMKISDIEFKGRTTYPLHLRIIPGQRCTIDIIYNNAIYSEEIIIMMLEDIEHLLVSLIGSNHQKVKDLRISAKATTSKDIIKTTNEFEELNEEETVQAITSLFEKRVEQYNDKYAVKTDSFCWTYSELNNIANNIAHVIVDKCQEDMIGLCFEHDAPMIAAILGVLKSDKAYVPLDSSYPPDRLKYILEDVKIKTIITDNSNKKFIEYCIEQGFNIIRFDNILLQEEYSNLDLTIEPSRLAYILYTSGSTGNPKGVMQNHTNVLRHIRNYSNNLCISHDDNLSLFSSYGFDASIMDIWGALLNGACLFPYDIKRQGLANMGNWIESNDISIFHSTPSVFRYFIDTLEDEKFGNVRLLVMGGEEVLRKDIESYKKHFNSNCIFVNGLGPSESTLALQYFIDHNTKINFNSVPVGYPVDGIELVLLDEYGNRADVFGEIGLISKQVALGYWNQQELTNKSFTKVDDNRKLYRTGDMGRLLPDGKLLFYGRKDFQVKVRGYRIELSDIEATIDKHPDVHSNIVVNKKTEKDENKLVAFVKPVEGKTLDIGLLRIFIKDRLPEYMMPDFITLIDDIPMTPTGKVNRIELLNKEIEYGSEVKIADKPYTAASNEVEKKLVQIWQDILSVENISIHDNFFEKGGHSLLLAKVHNRLIKEQIYQIQITDMFKYPTISSLANYIINGEQNDISIQEASERAERRRKNADERRRQLRKQVGK